MSARRGSALIWLAIKRPWVAMREMHMRGIALCDDAAQWLIDTARDMDAATIWIRQRLDWATGKVAIECRDCGYDLGSLPIWTIDTDAKRQRLCWPLFTRCAEHQLQHPFRVLRYLARLAPMRINDPTPDRQERDHQAAGTRSQVAVAPS